MSIGVANYVGINNIPNSEYAQVVFDVTEPFAVAVARRILKEKSSFTEFKSQEEMTIEIAIQMLLHGDGGNINRKNLELLTFITLMNSDKKLFGELQFLEQSFLSDDWKLSNFYCNYHYTPRTLLKELSQDETDYEVEDNDIPLLADQMFWNIFMNNPESLLGYAYSPSQRLCIQIY